MWPSISLRWRGMWTCGILWHLMSASYQEGVDSSGPEERVLRFPQCQGWAWGSCGSHSVRVGDPQAVPTVSGLGISCGSHSVRIRLGIPTRHSVRIGDPAVPTGSWFLHSDRYRFFLVVFCILRMRRLTDVCPVQVSCLAIVNEETLSLQLPLCLSPHPPPSSRPKSLTDSPRAGRA